MKQRHTIPQEFRFFKVLTGWLKTDITFMHSFKLILLSATIFLSGFVYGQATNEVDSLANRFVLDLKTKNIDTVCIYQSYCVGCIYNFKSEDKCNFEGGLFLPTYIIWLDKGRTYLTRKDNCFDYSTIQLNNDNFWRFYFNNEDTIKKETIKEPQYKVTENGKEKIYSSTVDHSRHQSIRMIIRQDTRIDKDLDEYYFEKEIGFGKGKNINYEYNINSALNKLADLISLAIKEETKKQKFVKTRR